MLPIARFETSATPDRRSVGEQDGLIGSGRDGTDRACDAPPVVGKRGVDRQVDDDAPNRWLDPGASLSNRSRKVPTYARAHPVRRARRRSSCIST